MNKTEKNIEHPYLDTLAILFVVALIAGCGLWYQSFKTAEAVKAKLVAEQRNEKKLVKTFEKFMENRAGFLALTTQVDSSLAQVKAKIDASLGAKKEWDSTWADRQAAYQTEAASVKAHNAAEDAKYKSDPRYQTRDYWQFPSYPAPPEKISVDFNDEIKLLTTESQKLKDYITALKIQSGSFKDPGINLMYSDLLKTAEAGKTAVDRDIEILGNIVIGAEEGNIANDAKADLIKYNAVDNGLRSVNQEAVEFIKKYGLVFKDYDVPGGNDATPTDKSTLI